MTDPVAAWMAGLFVTAAVVFFGAITWSFWHLFGLLSPVFTVVFLVVFLAALFLVFVVVPYVIGLIVLGVVGR